MAKRERQEDALQVPAIRRADERECEQKWFVIAFLLLPFSLPGKQLVTQQ